MKLRIYKFPLPERMKYLKENVLSVDLGKNVGFAIIKEDTLFCGCKQLDIPEWRVSLSTMCHLDSLYSDLIDALYKEFGIIDEVLLEQNIFMLDKRNDKNGKDTCSAFFIKLNMMAEAIFMLHVSKLGCDIRWYLGGSLKKKYFSTAKQSLVKEKVEYMLNTSRLSDHVTDSIAGLFSKG